jgi:hypothetical protein
VDLPEADLVALLEQDLADHLLEAVLVDRLLRVDLAVLVEVPAVVARAALAERLVVPEAPVAAAVRHPLTRSSIPWMAKFPTLRLLARNPTT